MNTAYDYNATTETETEYLDRIAGELTKALADVALSHRLKGSVALAALLTDIHETELAKQATAADDAAKAAKAARFSSYIDVTVIDKTPGVHVLGSSFEVSHTLLCYDMYARENVPTVKTYMGFDAVPISVLEYLIETYPSRIPSKIRVIAASPYDAFDRYFIGVQRGHMIGNAYDAQRTAA